MNHERANEMFIRTGDEVTQRMKDATQQWRGRAAQCAAVGVITVGALTACATTSSEDATQSSPASSSPASAAASSTMEAPDPCPPSMGQCDPVAAVDLDGSGKPAGVSFHPNGTAFLTVVTAEKERLSIDVGIDLEALTAPADTSELANAIAFYNLDGRPGAEVVVPVGTMGSNAVFQVFALRGDELATVTAPGEAFDITLGSSFWSFPGDRILARVMCRDGGITLGSTEMPSPKRGHEIDFVSETDGQKQGEASEWIVAGKAREVDPSAITDMSIGQTHFKCEDTRIESLLGSDRPLTPSIQGCDDSGDSTVAVESAIASIPAPPVGSWQADSRDATLLDVCSALGFVTITTDMPTNSSPVAVLLFHDGAFVGPASECFVPIESVEAIDDGELEVVYRYPEEGDSNAGMTGRATFTFTWRDGKVVKSGTAPARLTQLAGCTP